MDVFKMVCSEIDDLERNFTSTVKTTGKDIIKAYKEMVEDDSYTDFTDELSKFYNKNRQRLRDTCQNLFKSEDLLASKQQYLQEAETINKKTRDMARLFRVKTKSENRPAAPQTKPTQQKILIPRKKLQEIDINILVGNLHKKTHLQIQNRAAIKIQTAFRLYLQNKAHKGVKKNHTVVRKNPSKVMSQKFENKRIPLQRMKVDVKKVVKIQSVFRGYIARKKLNILRIGRGALCLKHAVYENRMKYIFEKMRLYRQGRTNLIKRVKEVLRIMKLRNIVTAKMNYQKLRALNKSDGKYKMAESYSQNYRMIQVFYNWLLITGDIELK